MALVVAALAAYHNSFRIPFVFDDDAAVVTNSTIQKLWPPWEALSPPINGGGVTGRPLVNFSLAVNYAIGGTSVRSYHAMNLGLHILVSLTLWGVLRRTWRQPVLQAAFPGGTELAAWTAVLLWTVHPLLTESVICVVQRNEIMGGLFYLLTLYGFIRATATSSVAAARGWRIVAVGACLAGMASKEIVATAPLLVLLYDRTFVAGTFREAWQRRKYFYGALVCTWGLLAWLMLHTGQRAGTVGFGLGVSSWEYLLTQCRALTTYLKLSFWPHPLVVDYGMAVAKSVGEVWWRGSIVVGLLAATLVALRRKPALGFLGTWFFVILAPSSSFVPLTTQTIAEHRMYLPLVAVIVLSVAACACWFGRRGLVALAVLAIGAGWMTERRNLDYQDDMILWSDTVAKQPENSRALSGLGTAYLDRGKLPEAQRYYAEALRLDPTSPHKHHNLALAFDRAGMKDEALKHYEEAVRLVPSYAPSRANIAMILIQRGRSEEAIEHLKIALTYLPDLARGHYVFGLALVDRGQWENAIKAFERAVALKTDYPEAEYNLGATLFRLNRAPEALRHLERAVQLSPEWADAHFNLGLVLASLGRVEEAMQRYAEATRLDPAHAETRLNRGVIFAQTGRLNEALEQLQAAVRLKPALAEAHANLGIVLAEMGRPQDAVASYEEALRLRPDYPSAHYNLGNALLQLRRWKEARDHFAEAVRLAPDWAAAREMLARLETLPVGP